MNDLTSTIQEVLGRQLGQNNFDLLDIVPIPSNVDRMVKLRTLEEALEDFSTSPDSGDTAGYLIQVQRKRAATKAIDEWTAKPSLDGIYLPNGALNIPYLAKNADILFESGEYALSKNIYRAILKSGERAALALFGIGKCLEAEGKLEEARSNYEESLTYHPNIDVYNRLSSLLIRQKLDREAAEVFARALNSKDLSNDLRVELHRACGNCWIRVQNYSEAEKHYLSAQEVLPGSDEIKASLGTLHLARSKIPEAKRCFQEALAINSKNEKALTGLGSCHYAAGELKIAHDCFKKALEIDLRNPTAIFYLVKCAYEIKSYAAAAKLLGDYVQTSPVNVSLLYSLAGLQFHLGRVQDAKSTTQKIIELQPQHSGAQELMNIIDRYACGS